MFDHRSHDRYEFTGDKVEYTLSNSDEIFEADIINYNQTGLCLLSTNFIPEGEKITIRDFMDVRSQDAIVIWVAKSDEDLFKIGLSFE